MEASTPTGHHIYASPGQGPTCGQSFRKTQEQPEPCALSLMAPNPTAETSPGQLGFPVESQAWLPRNQELRAGRGDQESDGQEVFAEGSPVYHTFPSPRVWHTLSLLAGMSLSSLKGGVI